MIDIDKAILALAQDIIDNMLIEMMPSIIEISLRFMGGKL